jgi:predicted ATPase/DNA-binding XRE family transcriptional regulator
MALDRSLHFGELLRHYRVQAGLTQEELAEQAGISAHAISQLERGVRRTPRRDTLLLLVKALQLQTTERAQLEELGRSRARTHPPACSSDSTASRAREIHRLPNRRNPAREIPPLVGRKAELARLEHHLAGDSAPVFLLAGEPGIGKTRLLAETGTQAQRQGWTVLEGGCHRRSDQEPYAPLLGALDKHLHRSSPAALRTHLSGCAWLVRLLPELAETMLMPAPTWTLPPAQERRLMFAAVARYFRNVSGHSGLLLVLDDLQWAGEDALDLLGSLVRATSEIPLRILGAYRSTEVSHADPLGRLLADLAAGELVTQYQLEPLDQPAARALLDSALGADEAVDDAVRERVVARAGGVPFFLMSCAQALRMGNADDVPWNVAESIRQRIALAPSAVQEVLGMTAIVGRSAPSPLLLKIAAAFGMQPQSVIEALEAATRVRLLVEAGAQDYHFPHDLVREVVLADLSVARRASLHQQVAEALEQGPGEAPVERLADHDGRGGDEANAILYSEACGEACPGQLCACRDAEVLPAAD